MARRKAPGQEQPEEVAPDRAVKRRRKVIRSAALPVDGEGFEQLALFGERPDRRRREWRRD